MKKTSLFSCQIITVSTLVLVCGSAFADDPVFFSWKRQHASSVSPAPQIPAMGTTLHYAYCPQPGGGHGWGLGTANTYIHDTWTEMTTQNLPVSLLLRSRNSPWGSAPFWDSTVGYPDHGSTITEDPTQLPDAMADRFLVGGQINYVLADLEAHGNITSSDVDTWMTNIKEIVTGASSLGVTGDPFGTGNTNVPQSAILAWNTVYFGNYSTHRFPTMTLDHDGTLITAPTDITMPWVGNAQNDTVTGRHNTFISVAPNVLMPVTYAYFPHVRHTFPDHFSGEFSPNTRAAYLWSGIERFSSAVREENTYGSLTGKKIIPWVTPFVPATDVNLRGPQSGAYAGSWMPPSEDFSATIQHLRLRGADGFYFWANAPDYTVGGRLDKHYWSTTDSNGKFLNPWYTSNAPWLDAAQTPNGYDWFEADALISWEALDGNYADDAVTYRLYTDKESGDIVSAVNDKGQLHILVSYMHSLPQGLQALFNISSYFNSARDYRFPGGSQIIAASGYSHNYTSNFFTPDIDGDFDADFDDIVEWINLFLSGDLRADWNQDQVLDLTDYNLLVSAYTAFNS